MKKAPAIAPHGITVPHQVTGTHGERLLPLPPEPGVGSVVLTHGPSGAAWQKTGRDGLWRRMGGGRPKTWDEVTKYRNTWLVYIAPNRDEAERTEVVKEEVDEA